MTAEGLLKVIGDIRDEYVWEAEVTVKVKKIAWVKWVAVAACLVVAACIAVPWLWGGMSQGENNVNGPSGKLISSNSSLFGGANARMPYERDYLYYSYEELSQDYADPVFAALESSAIAREHKITFGLVYTANPQNATNEWDKIEWGNEYLIEARVAIDAPGQAFYGEDVPAGMVHCINNDDDEAMWDYDFMEAESYGTRTDYLVDGVEVQKYDSHTTFLAELENLGGNPLPSSNSSRNIYHERISINGEWYYVYSENEDLADALATDIARIAAGN